MNNQDLKKVLKPLIKQCIKECIFEEGVLSGIISEVVKGVGPSLVSEKQYASKPDALEEQRALREKEIMMENKRQERIRRLNESMKGRMNDVGVFENTSTTLDAAKPGDPLAGVSPSDKGVDIDGILKIAGSKWQRMV